MKPSLRYIGARSEPVASLAAAAGSLWGLLQASRDLRPRSTRLFVLTGSYKRAALLDPQPLGKALSASQPKRPSEVVPGVPPYQVTVIAADGGHDILHLAAGFATSKEGRTPGVTVEMGIAERALAGAADPIETAARLFELLVQALDLGAARVVPGEVTMSSELSRRARVGWLTFLPERLGPLPALPPRAASIRVDRLGWILRAQPELPCKGCDEYTKSLAHLRHALGARVLLDGPSFPPPSAAAPEAPAAPPRAEPVPAPAPAPAPAPEIPSYLKAAPSPGPVPAPEPAPAPARSFTTETGAVDISKLVKPAVPFEPDGLAINAASAPRASSPQPAQASMSTETAPVDISKLVRGSVPFGPSQQDTNSLRSEESPPANRPLEKAPAGVPGFGETEEFNLDALLKRPRPVPFEPASTPAPAAPPEPAPKTAPTASAPGAAPQRRLVRFDPQTGQPLAQPYWEELPPPARKP